MERSWVMMMHKTDRDTKSTSLSESLFYKLGAAYQKERSVILKRGNWYMVVRVANVVDRVNYKVWTLMRSILSTKTWLPHVWKWTRFENACPTFGASLPPLKNCGPKLAIFDVFRRLRNLTANISEKKHYRHIDNREWHWKRRRVSYTVLNFHELWSTNYLK